MRKILPIVMLLFGEAVYCQNWEVAGIPESMKQSANVVVREENQLLDIKSIDKAFVKNYEVYTILNEKGKERLQIVEITDPFHSLEDLSVKMYDADGKLLKKYNKKDMQYFFAGDGLITDTKYNVLSLQTTSYPVTIEYSSETLYKGSLQYPSYFLQLPEQSLMHGIYSVSVPTDLDIRYVSLNSSLKPEIKTDAGLKNYKWEARMLPALQHEAMAVSQESRYPIILIVPNKFTLDGEQGDMRTWKDFGSWYGGLAKSTLNFDEEKKDFFKTLVKNASTNREKASLIYHYLQDNFRYVSIQLGIGGFRPFPAMLTDKNKYGDCKALTNYTQAALDAVGIKSYHALINAGSNKMAIDPAIPRNGFNHVILCVPNNKDTFWLECTSNTNDFGVLGNFTENRNALLITEDGGHIVPTPKSTPQENTLSTKSVVSLSSEGEGRATVWINTTGEYKGFQFTKEKKDFQKIILLQYFGFPQPDNFELKNGDKRGQYVLSLEIEKLPSMVTSGKMFLDPRLYRIWKLDLPTAENRTLDVYFPNPFVKDDTTIYQLPEGYKPETIPAAVELSVKAAEFISKYTYNAEKGELTSICRLVLKKHIIPVADYAETKAFFDAVLKEFNAKIVIRKD